MPTKTILKMPALEGVDPGFKATCDLPIGPRYHMLEIAARIIPATGQIAKIEDILGLITVKLGEKAQRQMTALELNALNTLNGAEYAYTIQNITDPGTAPAANDEIIFRIPILFAEPFRKSYSAGELMAWPTRFTNGANVGTFQLEIEVPNVAGTSGHSIEVFATQDGVLGSVDANGNPILLISKWTRQNVTYTASGERQLMNLSKRDLCQQMSFFTQTADPITHIKIKRENAEILDVDKVVNDTNLVRYGLNSAGISANRLDVVFDRDDLPDSALPLNGVSKWEVTPTLASAAATNKIMTLITQSYGPRD